MIKKENKFLSRHKPYLLTMVCMLLLLCLSPSVRAAEASTVVKVAFMPVQAGFYNIDDNGNYSGYNYDYLMEVAAHTGWEYEFVLIDEGWNSYAIAKEMLANGEIDLLGPMFTTDSEAYLYQYGNYPNGISRHALCTSPNSGITADNYFFHDFITAALVEGSTAVESFCDLMELYNVPYEIIFVETEEDAMSLVFEGSADVIMSWDVASIYGEIIALETVSPTPFYFVSRAGEEELIGQLDMAAEQLDVAEPLLSQRLRGTYFEYLHQGDMIFSGLEEEVISNTSSLRVGLLKGVEPYQFYDPEEGASQGITIEILEEMSRLLSIPFHYVWVDSYEELAEKIAAEEIDMIGSLPFDYAVASSFSVTLTRPYLCNGVVWLHQEAEQDTALPYYYFVSQDIQKHTSAELQLLTELDSALWDLAETGGISIYTDPNIAQYYLQKHDIDNVVSQTVSTLSSNLSLGVGKHVDTTIVGLLNHSILHLEEHFLDEIVYNNVIVKKGISLDDFLKENIITLISLLVVFLLLVVFSLCYHSMKLRDLSRRDGLTHLYNSGYFHQYAQDKSRKITHGALILIDIDLFKQVNDTYGHQTGDLVITTVAQNLEEIFGSGNMVARLGGDEFIILLEKQYPQDVLEEKCQKLLEVLKSSVKDVPVTLSIGGVIFQQSMEYQDLYRFADENLYKVKENGRNNYVISDNSVAMQ